MLARLKSSLQREEGSDAQSNGDEPVDEAAPVLDAEPVAPEEAPVEVVPTDEPVPVVPVEEDELAETLPMGAPLDEP
jgi:hypothetical protein